MLSQMLLLVLCKDILTFNTDVKNTEKSSTTGNSMTIHTAMRVFSTQNIKEPETSMLSSQLGE